MFNNTQVFYILNDSDVKFFFKTLLMEMKKKDKNAISVEDEISDEN